MAQTPTPTPAPKFKIERNQKSSGLPAIKLIFIDGREAESVIYGPEKMSLKTQLTTTENLCHPEMPAAKCLFHADAYVARVNIVWTKHSEGSKIGQALMGAFNQKLSAELTFTGSFQFSPDNAAQELYENYSINTLGLSCNQFGWLTGDLKSRPQSFRIESILTETMTQNRETGNDENRISATFNNVVFKKEDNTNIYRSARRGNKKNEIYLPFATTFAFVVGENSCQITGAHNLAELIAQYQGQAGNVEKNKPAVYLSNEVSSEFGSSLEYKRTTGEDFQ